MENLLYQIISLQNKYGQSFENNLIPQQSLLTSANENWFILSSISYWTETNTKPDYEKEILQY